MKMLLSATSIGLVFILLMVTISFNTSFAESQTNANIVSHGEKLHLEKTVLKMTISNDNTSPWAFVEGKIKNHAQDYPVIVQIFGKESKDPIHVAQVGVNNDGSYEYKFRVRDVNLKTGEVTQIFEGEYTVKIFKVINNSDNRDSV